jgi:hypothetical protein
VLRIPRALETLTELAILKVLVILRASETSKVRNTPQARDTLQAQATSFELLRARGKAVILARIRELHTSQDQQELQLKG